MISVNTEVKVFYSCHGDGLESQINDFLSNSEVEIIDIKFAHSFGEDESRYREGFSALVLFEYVD